MRSRNNHFIEYNNAYTITTIRNPLPLRFTPWAVICAVPGRYIKFKLNINKRADRPETENMAATIITVIRAMDQGCKINGGYQVVY